MARKLQGSWSRCQLSLDGLVDVDTCVVADAIGSATFVVQVLKHEGATVVELVP
jgi:hypothetical protein